ncbi:MAG: hypothetical protein JXA92_14105 [candidate division Zixibacteria bacterium]|nr:hypothetical protein [candidate division Zixibacteria bacterium]
MKRYKTIINERGFVTLIALLMVGMLTLIGLAALSTSDDEVSIAGNELQDMRAFYAAEAGLDKAAAEIQYQYEQTGVPPTSMPTGSEELNNCQVTYATVDDGSATQRTLTTGSLAGLHALVKTFSINSVAQNNNGNAKLVMSQTFETALVPIFQFAVFYENDLWTTPANDMTVTGRVHVNGNMYLQCSKTLSFDGRITSSGSIYHGFPSGYGVSVVDGDVRFKDADGSYESMYQGGYWLDAKRSDWYDKAMARWGNNVRDKAFGQEELNLPLTNSSGDPHKIIERASGNPDSYESKATFKILDGVPYYRSSYTGTPGVWSNVSALLPAGTITNTSFYDDREDQWVNSTDIDMALLASSGYFPSNGVLYSSDQRSGYNGTRLVNGSDIGNALSVYSENPVYVRGNYNTSSTNKQPAAIIADCVTFLSNSWDDAKSSLSLSSRTVSPTTVNVSIISGDQNPQSTSYGGGLANLPRFLEDWNTTTFTIQGSMVCLWRAQQSTGIWKYGTWDAYYTAPTRDYRFDPDLNDPNKLPPETPMVRSFQRTGWQQQFVGYEE